MTITRRSNDSSMNSYIVVYEIVNKDGIPNGRNYDYLVDAIKQYRRFAKLTENCWIIITSEDSAQIRNRLMRCLNDYDRIIVVKMGDECAWAHLITQSDWIKNNCYTYINKE